MLTQFQFERQLIARRAEKSATPLHAQCEGACDAACGHEHDGTDLPEARHDQYGPWTEPEEVHHLADPFQRHGLPKAFRGAYEPPESYPVPAAMSPVYRGPVIGGHAANSPGYDAGEPRA